jgi:hypothetical protein
VDLSVDRPGRVLDSFSELHGVVGSWPVIAPSFEAFLVSVWQTRGDHLYWAPPSGTLELLFPDAYAE